LALFPPAKADPKKQHDNATSRAIIAAIGDDKHNWSDLFALSPPGKASDVDQKALASFIENCSPEACTQMKEVWARVVSRFNPDDAMSNVVWLAGGIVQKAFEYLRSDAIIPTPTSSFTVCGIDVHVFPGFVAMEAVHPSYHLLKHSDDTQRSFDDACGIFKALRQGCRTEELVLDHIKADSIVRHAELLRMCDALEIPHHNGKIDSEYRHLRHVRGSLLATYQSLKGQVEDAVFRCCCRYSSLHVDDTYVKSVVKLSKKLTPAQFVTFMCDGVAARLDDDDFVKMLDEWMKKLGVAKFVTFMNGGVACRLDDDDFVKMLDQWMKKLTPAKFATFMNGGVACRLKDDDFVNALKQWMKTLGTNNFVKFMCDGVAANLLKPAFVDELNRWLAKLKADNFAKFMCDGVACRLLIPAFVDELDRWLAKLKADKFAKFMCDGVASRLLDSKVIGDSVAACRIDSKYVAALKQWLKTLGTDSFVTFIGDGVASRLLDSNSVAIMERWLKKLKPYHFATFMSQGGVVARLHLDAFVEEFDTLMETTTPELVKKRFLNGMKTKEWPLK
jgi:hypothetical protein